MNIIVDNQIPANTNLLYELATRGFDISPLDHYFEDYDMANLKEEIMVKVGIIMHHIPNQKENIN